MLPITKAEALPSVVCVEGDTGVAIDKTEVVVDIADVDVEVDLVVVDKTDVAVNINVLDVDQVAVAV